MLKKIVNVVILLPLAVILIALCLANRDPVTLALNPFRPSDAVLSVSAPFFVFLFAALMLGIVLGGIGAWLGQSRHRQRARRERREAEKWHVEADRQRERANDLARQSSGSEPQAGLPKAVA